MKRKPKLPHGMTENMMQIAEISSVAKSCGRHYGAYVARMGDSLPGATSGKHGSERVCLGCGTDISHRRAGTKYCEECGAKRRSAVNAEYKKRKRGNER